MITMDITCSFSSTLIPLALMTTVTPTLRTINTIDARPSSGSNRSVATLMNRTCLFNLCNSSNRVFITLFSNMRSISIQEGGTIQDTVVVEVEEEGPPFIAFNKEKKSSRPRQKSLVRVRFRLALTGGARTLFVGPRTPQKTLSSLYK